MKNKNQNKGFTIVELVIVIAVIGILAAVLLPTFKNIIEKANTANDMQIVVNLNKALEIEKASQPGCDYQTPYDAFAVAKSYGYTVEKIVAKSNLNIAYDQMNKRFVLLDETTNTIVFPVSETEPEESFVEEEDRVNYFAVRTNAKGFFNSIFSNGNQDEVEYSNYSVYAGYKFNAKKVILNGVGFDAGDSESVEKIIYSNDGTAKNILIRTNSYETTMSVDGVNDTVEHYGKVGAVIVLAVADHSYIEYGDGGIVQVNDGHIVIKSNSNITKIHFTKAEKENDNDEDKFEDITITIENGANMPEMTRDSVELNDTSEIKVCTIEANNKSEDVILTKQGIVEQVKLVSNSDNESKSERYAEYVEKPLEEEDKQNGAAVMLSNDLNGFNRNDNGIINNIVVTNKDSDQQITSVLEISFDYDTREFVFNQTQGDKLSEEELNEQLNDRIKDTGRDAEEVLGEAIAQYFPDVWDGTADTSWYNKNDTEFVITTCEQLAGLAELVNEGNSFEGKTIKLGRDLNLNENPDFENFEGMTNWTAIGYAYGSYIPKKPFSGTFDGQGHSISNMFRRCYNCADYYNDKKGAIYPYALFGCVKDGIIKNLIIDSAYLAGETDIWYTNAMGGFVGVAFGDCTFDSLTLKNSYLCGYISNVGGIVGGCTSGNMTFNNISVDNTNVLTTWDWGKWSSCDCQMGGIIGQIDIQDSYPDKDHTNNNGLYTTHVSLNNCYVACQLMQMNDVMSNYAWYQYRSSGMLIGGLTHNKSDGLWNNCDNVTDIMLQNALTCNNVKVEYDLWNHQYYCCAEEHDSSRTYSGDHAGRFDKDNNLSNEIVGTHKDGCCGEHDCLVFDQLIGGWSGGTWRYETGNNFEAYAGVTVTYLNNSQPEE